MKEPAALFNEKLHERLDGEREHELKVSVLESFYQELRACIDKQHWPEDEGLRQLLALGRQQLQELSGTDKALDEMSPEEKMRFLQQRWSAVEAAYSMLKFTAYQVMNRNDVLEMTSAGLAPQLQVAQGRITALEDEVKRLRALVPEHERAGGVLIGPQEAEEHAKPSFREQILGMFSRRD